MARNLWGESVNITCHTINKVYFRPDTKKTPYELWKRRKPNVKYFRIFGIERMWENLTFEAMKEYF